MTRPNTAQQAHVSKLKGLFQGFKQFCSDEGFDCSNILKTISLESFCPDLDILLTNNAQTDQQYVNQVKDFFFEYWHL